MGNSSKSGGRYSLLLTLFQTIKCHFPHPFSYREEVIKRNITCLHKTAVIIAEIRMSTKKSILNSLLLLPSYSFGIETTNTFMRDRSSLDHTRFQTKIGKICTRFRTKTAQKPHHLEQHIPLYGFYKVAPPGP